MLFSVLLLLCIAACSALSVLDEIFQGPTDLSAQPEWLQGLKSWRTEVLRKINYNPSIYDDPALNWTRTSYVQPLTHLWDRYLYDPVRHKWTVDKYLDDVSRRYGGIDSILIWPTYPNLGIDARNQFDYYRALPGGLPSLTQLTAELKSHGVRVLWAYSPWDQGLRDEGEPHWVTLAKLLKETDADGFNGDTMNTMYKQFWDAGITVGHRIVGEMEFGGYPGSSNLRLQDRSWASANWAGMGWSNVQWAAYFPGLGIDKLKWLDGRHMTHGADRWSEDRMSAFQFAFLNGVGYESWENVWGTFMHFTQRDGEALRRVATMLRWLGQERFIQDYAEWEPYTSDVKRPLFQPFSYGGLIGSKFVHKSGDCAWLIVNRASEKAVVEVNVSTCRRSHFYDLYHGVALSDAALLSVDIEPYGYAAVIATSRDLQIRALLKKMHGFTRVPLEHYSTQWAPLQQEMVKMKSMHSSRSPEGMVLIPRTSFRFRTAGVMIEGGCDQSTDTWGICCRDLGSYECPGDPLCFEPCSFPYPEHRGVDVQFPWESVPGRFHDKTMELGPFYIDAHLVTKGDYARYLNISGYKPRDLNNYLVDWKRDSSGGFTPVKGTERQPVVWVSLQEARAFCSWSGKRLPHAYEWQLAAQGANGSRYPWGNELDSTRFPKAGHARKVPPLPDIGTFSPAGDSVYGMADVVGHVWQYTDEFQDEHSRAVLLKGSSLYNPMIGGRFPSIPQKGSWYFPKALQLDRHGKMFLMDDSYERAGTLGFRCVADHEDGQAGPYHFREAPAVNPSKLWEDGIGQPSARAPQPLVSQSMVPLFLVAAISVMVIVMVSVVCRLKQRPPDLPPAFGTCPTHSKDTELGQTGLSLSLSANSAE